MTKLNLPFDSHNSNSTLGCKPNERTYSNKHCVPTASFCSSENPCPKGTKCIDGVCQCTPNAGMYITLVPSPINIYSMGCAWNEKVDAASCKKHEYRVEKTCILNYCSKDVPCFAGVCDEEQHMCIGTNATHTPLPTPSHYISIKDVETSPTQYPDIPTSHQGLPPLTIILIVAGAIVGLMFVGGIIRCVLLSCSSAARWAFGAKKGAVRLYNDESGPDGHSGGDDGSRAPGTGPGAAAGDSSPSAPTDIERPGNDSGAYPPSPLTGTTLTPNMSRASSRASGVPPSPMHSPMYPPYAQQRQSRQGCAPSPLNLPQQARNSFYTQLTNGSSEHQLQHGVAIEMRDQSGHSAALRMPPPSVPPSPLKSSYTASAASSVVDFDSGVSGMAMKAPLADDAAGYMTIDLNDRSDTHANHPDQPLQTATANPIRRSLSAPSLVAVGIPASAAATQSQDANDGDSSENKAIRDSCTLPAPPHDTQGWNDLKAQQRLHRSSTTIPTLTMTPAPLDHSDPEHHQAGRRNSRLMPVPYSHQLKHQQQLPQQEQYPAQGPQHRSLHHSYRSSESLRGPISPPDAHYPGGVQERTLRHFQSAPAMNQQLHGGPPYYSGLEPPRPPFAPGLRKSMTQHRPLSTASVTPEARHLPPGFESAPVARPVGVQPRLK